MDAAHDQPVPRPRGWDVLDAARRAWEWYGITCHVRTAHWKPAGIVGALDLPDRRHVEVIVDDASEDVWSTLGNWAAADEWIVRAVVPLPALGRAHEALRERGCELQGYWVQDDGRVAFGSVERA